MSTTQRFFEVGRTLVADQSLSTPLLKAWQGSASTIRIGWFLGSIAVLPVDGQHASVHVYGDVEMAELLQIRTGGPNLFLDGRLPFRSGVRLGTEELSSISARSGVVGGDVRVAMNEEHIFVNDDALDLGRSLLVVLAVPLRANIEVRALIGTLRISGALRQGSLFVSQLGIPRVFAAEIGSFIGQIAKYGEVHPGIVRGGFKVETWLGGCVKAESVGGKLDVVCWNGGRVVIDGGTSEGGMAVEMGGGCVEHHGTVNGGGYIEMRGPGHAIFPSVLGEVTVYCPPGVVDLNGRRYGS